MTQFTVERSIAAVHRGVFAALFVVGLWGCVPLVDVPTIRHAPPAEHMESRSEATVQSAIGRASARAGWEVMEDGGGTMVLSRSEKRRRAVLSVSYDANHYSIRYRDSEGFSYRWSPVADYGGTIINGERARAHRDFKEWIQALDRMIQEELTVSRP